MDLQTWIENGLEQAEEMLSNGSYDGEDYWQGVTDTLLDLKRKLAEDE